MWEPAGGQIGDGLTNHSQFLDWLYWPHHPPEQRPIDQSDISTRKKFFNHPWHWLATVGFLSFCRWSATSCRQPWCNCKALTYTFPFWIVGITWNRAERPPGKFEAGLNSSLPWPMANLQRRPCQPLYFGHCTDCASDHPWSACFRNIYEWFHRVNHCTLPTMCGQSISRWVSSSLTVQSPLFPMVWCLPASGNCTFLRSSFVMLRGGVLSVLCLPKIWAYL